VTVLAWDKIVWYIIVCILTDYALFLMIIIIDVTMLYAVNSTDARNFHQY